MDAHATLCFYLDKLATCLMTAGDFDDIVRASQGCRPGLTFAVPTTHRGT